VSSTQVQHACTALIAGGAAVGFMWLYAKGKTPSVTFDERAVQNTYSPYSHFMHQSNGGWVRHFPAEVGANCLPMVYQNEQVGKSVSGVEVDDASYAQ
jgi:hypothetical protein